MERPYILVFRAKDRPIFQYGLTKDGKLKCAVVDLPENENPETWWGTSADIDEIEDMLLYVFENDIAPGEDECGNKSVFEDWTQYFWERTRSDGSIRIKSFK